MPVRPSVLILVLAAALVGAEARAEAAPDAAALAAAPIDQIVGTPSLNAAALKLGEQTFRLACAVCHGGEMTGGTIVKAPNLAAGRLSAPAEVERRVRYGVESGHPNAVAGTGLGLMPAFEGVLSEAELKSVSVYIAAAADRR